jgi:hypothetical protein
MIGVQVGADLTHHADFDALFRRWLSGDDGALGSARDELQAFLGGREREPIVRGPAWEATAWRERWLHDLLDDMPDDADREAARMAVARLAAGEAEVVITGQQPGFLGGPLYTCYKIATAVVTAELRTAAGTPTVPVFWSAGDDDDLREALQPVAWDPHRRVLLRHEDAASTLRADRMVGALAASAVAPGAATWLGEVASRHRLAADLAAIWGEGVAADLGWGRLQRRGLLRIFAGRGLLVVHGDDADMHAVAEPFYADLWSRREGVREAARRGGAQLEAAGHARPLGEPSIQRFLHRGLDGRRQPLAADHAGDLPPAAELRPGVVARSPVQDWLFRPAGVVVGPGEVAYLKQLRPVYHLLGLSRSPLLPRLFAQFGPEGHGAFRAWALELADREETPARTGDREAAARLAEPVGPELRAFLERETGADGARLDQLTGQVLRRWGRYLAGVVDREQRRRRDRPRGEHAPWLRPDGRRQERSLAAAAAAALWGDEFTDALAHASRRHVDAGLAGDWREYLLTVPDPGGDPGP